MYAEICPPPATYDVMAFYHSHAYLEFIIQHQLLNLNNHFFVSRKYQNCNYLQPAIPNISEGRFGETL